MKKVISVLVVVFSVFMMISCRDDKATTISPDFVIDIPSNLQIDGTTLSWNPVFQATGYYIYVNHELNTRVTSTSFDFSSLTDDVLIFQVQADAPLGFEDSILSLSVAFMKNADTEKEMLSSMLENMNIPDGFVDALIYKGMTSEGMATLLSSIVSFGSIFGSDEVSLADVSEELQSFISLDMNYEALLYALITVMPEVLQEEVDFYNERLLEIDGCDLYANTTDCDEMIEQLTTYISGLNETILLIENSPDAILYSMLDTLSYLFSVAGILDPALVTQIQLMINSESSATLNINELLIVKSEIVDTLLENLPNSENLALLIQLGGAFFSAYGAELPSNEIALENANQIIVFVETFAGVLDSIDETFITDISSIVETFPESYTPEVIIYLIKHFHDYFDEHQGIVMEWNTFFSDTKKEEIFMNMFSLLSASMNIQLNISYEMMDVILQSIFDQSDNIYTWFLTSDGELIRLYYQLDQISMYGSDYELQMINARINYEWLLLVNQLLPTIDLTLTSIFKTALASVPMEKISSDLTLESYQALLIQLNDIIDEEIPVLIDLVYENTQEMMDKEFYNLYLAELEEFNQYVIDTYGENYMLDQNYYTDPAVLYFNDYIMEKWIALVISSEDQTALHDYLDNLVLALSTSNFEEATGMTLNDLEYIIQFMMLPVDTRIEAATEISGYDLYNLTPEQIAKFESLNSAVN